METRAPASAGQRGDSLVSPLRTRLLSLTVFAPACPAEVKELLAGLSFERVKYPPCAKALQDALDTSRTFLSLEESSAVEELLNVQCRLNPREGIPDVLQSLMQDDGKKPAPGAEAAFQARARLRDALVDTRNAAEPLQLWVRNNGEFVFPEEQLSFFDRLVSRDACRMPDQEVDVSYRTLRSLEELVRIEAESEPQRGRIERFLGGVHKVIDRKIQEFFRR